MMPVKLLMPRFISSGKALGMLYVVVAQMNILQSLKLTYRFWNASTKSIPSKIYCDQINELIDAAEWSFQLIIWKRERCHHGTITKAWRDTSTELILRSRIANDGALTQKLVGICPIKLLLLMLSATRFFITSHMLDGNCPVKKLLEIFSTCRGHTGVSTKLIEADIKDGDASGQHQFQWLRDAKDTSVTVLFALQATPSHLQQSVPFFHVTVRLLSCESPARNWRRELLSCSVQELVVEAKKSRTAARPSEIVGNLLLFFMCENLSGSMLAPAPKK
ncbi:LOW QUALITY PROTEIN: hypothetical protein U9M48_025694 [Paspalum notatum var. saurae]|uniref:Uncharacterized protein n=1 Tax=Paspalum notatum var. saurae TaxID=547442 RepID=A0AAQ3WXL8_PASNO